MAIDDLTEAALRRRTGAKWSHFPADVLPAWVADMDFDVAAPIRDALASRLVARDLGYPGAHRLPALFMERVAARFRWAIEVERIVVLNDVVQGLYLCLQTLAAAGEGAVIQTPIYPPFLHAVAETGRRAVLCPLIAGDTRHEIDFAQMEQAIDRSTRLLLLCNPHNPTGRAYTRTELEQLAELACRHSLIIVSDEIHADLVLAGARHIPIATLSPEVAARTVTLMSASKAFNIAGLCMAFAHFGSAALQERFHALPPHTRGGTNTMSVAAVAAAWTASQGWQDEVVTYLGHNRDHVAAYARAHWPRARHFAPEATYLAWFDMRPLALPCEPCEFFLAQARVALSDGRTFGADGGGHVRLNFATSRLLLDEVLARMTRALTAAGAL